jgi:hypothetical protein
MDAKTLRERIAQAREKHVRIGSELQQAAIAFAERRSSAGLSWKAIGAELGMSHHTLIYWRDRHRPANGSRLARVEVVDEKPSSPIESFVVHTAAGLRIEKMSVQQVAELMVRLR